MLLGKRLDFHDALAALPFAPHLRYTVAQRLKAGLCVMKAEVVAQRAALFWLSLQHPEWTHAELAATVGCSDSWIKKLLAHFKQATVTAHHALARHRRKLCAYRTYAAALLWPAQN